MQWTCKDAIRLVQFFAIIMWMGGSNQAVPQNSVVFIAEEESPDIITLSGNFSPYWSHGALITVEDSPSDAPVILRIRRNADSERIRFSIPNGHHITIRQLASAADSAIAVIGSVYSDDGRGTTFLARIQPDRKYQTVTQLWPYVPSVVTFAPDGTIWSIGRVRDGDLVSQWNVLKRFDTAGKLLSTTTIEAKPYIHSGDDPNKPRIRDAADVSILRSSKDRVAWFTNGNEYIEFSLDGQERGRLDGPDQGCLNQTSASMALGQDNEVVIGPTKCQKPGYWRLDRPSGRWEPVGVSSREGADQVIVLGFDGNTLVATTARGTIRRYVTKEAH